MFKDIVTDIFFDLDHTLWDFEKNSALTFHKILIENKVDVEVASFLKEYVPINFAYWKLYREEKISKEQLRFQRLRATFNALGHEISDKDIHVIAADYIKYLSSFSHLFPDAIAVLEYLKPKYNLHIITNGFQEVQHKKMLQSGISNYFSTVVNSEMAGVKKPNPLIFEMALKLANTSAQKSLMIGDSLEADIIGAKAVGFKVLHFNTHQEPKHNHSAIVEQLIEIKNYL